MMTPRRLFSSVLCLALIVCAGVSFKGSRATTFAQQKNSATDVADELKRGLTLYQQGNDKGAIEVLRRVVKQRQDIVAAWHYLGLAYERQGKMSDARKAHEKATLAGESLLDALFSNVPHDQFKATLERYKPQLALAAESANRYLKLISKPSAVKVSEWTAHEEMLREYAEMAAQGQNGALGNIYRGSEVTTKARILSKPEPQYTEAARQDKVSGRIIVTAVLAFDGKVRGIRVMNSLPDGLTLKCIEAARRIKFIPATVNGQPVSQWVEIEYNFNVY